MRYWNGEGRRTVRRSLMEDILHTSFMEHGELVDFLQFMCVWGGGGGLCALVFEGECKYCSALLGCIII